MSLYFLSSHIINLRDRQRLSRNMCLYELVWRRPRGRRKRNVSHSLLSFIPTLFPTPPPFFGMLYRLTKVPLNDATKLLNCVSRTGIYCNLNVTYLSEKRTLICFKVFYTARCQQCFRNLLRQEANQNGTLWTVRSFLLLGKFSCYC